MLDKLTSENFAPHLHETFQLSLATWGQPYDPAIHGDALPVELIEVAELGDPAALDLTRRRPFSLIFRAPGGGHLPQQTYTISHTALGQLDMFLVPIGPDGSGMRYQAIFT